MRRGTALAKVTIHIPQVAWRDGRPRYQPGPKARGLGMKGLDLKTRAGQWMSAEQARDWVEQELQPRLTEIRAAKAAGKRAPRRRAPNAFTVEDLFEAVWRLPKYAGTPERPSRPARVTGGAVGVKPAIARKLIAGRTLKDYRQKADSLIAYDPDLGGTDVAALTKPILVGLYEGLWRQKGHHMANGIMAVLRLALGEACRRGWGGLTVNPALQLGMETPPARLRVGSFTEMRTLIAAADAVGESMIGHAIMLGLMTAQRQAERLTLLDVGHREGWRRFRQSKTGAIVEVPETPQLAARLAAARELRQTLKINVANVIVHPRTGRIYEGDAYRRDFARVRAAAVKGIRTLDGAGWIVEACPSLADFRDQDLRDTAVTWLADASATHLEIASITGHSLQTIATILKHYCATTPTQASAAIRKLVTYLESEGAVL